MVKALRVWAAAGTALLALAPRAAESQTPLGAAFTYQGRLSDGGAPASGTYDLEFRLFTAASGGSPVGAAVLRDDVSVSSGLFTVALDFGAGAFPGSARWLEIGVRPGTSQGPFTTLSPRQELTPTPNALFGATSPWSGLLGVPAGFADGIDNDSGGDITSINAGTGLTGGAASGPATLSVDTAAIQSRVTGTCAAGYAIRTISQDGTVGCEQDDVGTGWHLTGNAGTNPATDFVGTSDNQPLVLRANNTVGFRLVGDTGTPAIVGGFSGNSVTGGVPAATIAGGGASGQVNRVTDAHGTIGGGSGNRAGNDAGTTLDAYAATVGGGLGNTAAAHDATVAGGNGNTAGGAGAMVPGGYSNAAGGEASFAAGFRARVRDAAASGDTNGDEGSFIWADSSPPFDFFTSTGPNQFLIRATGGVGINTNAPAFPLDVAGVIRSRTGGFQFPDGTSQATAALEPAADITGVNAGAGLTGGGASGSVTLAVDSAAVQLRVSGVCPAGQSVRVVNQDGTVGCETDDNSGGTVTAVTAGTGLTGGTITTSGTLGVAFGGAGAAATAARSDHNHDSVYANTSHNHLGQTWVGATTPGLKFLVSGTSAVGLWSESSGTNSRGVFGWATAPTGLSVGVWGETLSTAGMGVFGRATALTGLTYGVYGENVSDGGRGVAGASTAPTGNGVGVFGRAASTTGGTGVQGIATATSGFSYGVEGVINSPVGAAVRGRANGGTGETHGVEGQTASSEGRAVWGWAIATTGDAIGVWGRSNSSSGRGVYGIATSTAGGTTGVLGESNSTFGAGVSGRANATAGPARGVEGTAVSPDGTGVMGFATSTTGASNAIWGENSSEHGRGVYGHATSTAALADVRGVMGEVESSSFQAYAVAGYAPAGAYAGFFSGRVHVNGSLSKASGSFKIDHPLDPENKYLYHSFVESPDMMNVYNGNVTTDAAGYATVELPDWFEALNREFRYQLTVIDGGEAWALAKVVKKIEGNRFTIRTSVPGVEVSWQVTGIRRDPYAEAHRIPVEEDKPAVHRGTYLHPEAWGQPPEKSVDHRPAARAVSATEPVR